MRFCSVQIPAVPRPFPARLKTRIAPTPSGYLHLGNVFSFALTAFLAENCGARILLRIDDLDRERVRPEYIQDIFDTLHFLELPWHEGPRDATMFANEYAQEHRMPLYRQALEQLKEDERIFACNCSRKRILAQNEQGIYTGTCIHKHLDPDTTDVSWRLYTPPAAVLQYHGSDGPAEAVLPATQQYFIVRKKDTFPAYQLASVVDDIFFGVDLTVRGQDLYDSTLAQLYLAQALSKPSFGNTVFYHHDLLLALSGDKLSKSAGDTSVRYLRKEGWKPADIYTLIGKALGIPEPLNDWRTLADRYWLLKAGH